MDSLLLCDENLFCDGEQKSSSTEWLIAEYDEQGREFWNMDVREYRLAPESDLRVRGAMLKSSSLLPSIASSKV
jgi:hypothetical protein